LRKGTHVDSICGKDRYFGFGELLLLDIVKFISSFSTFTKKTKWVQPSSRKLYKKLIYE